MVDISGVSNASNATSAASNASAKIVDDFDDFLTLLTTQLQNQDPTDPLDSNAFTQQLVAFAGVEQQINTNKNLEALSTLIQVSNLASTASYLGNDALIAGDLGILEEGDTGGITWYYQNHAQAEELTLEVVDSNNNVVFSKEGEKTNGQFKFEWDGVRDDGTVAEPGIYQLNVKAKSPEGAKLNPAIAVEGTIIAVDTTSLQPIFTVGPNQVTQNEIYQLVYGKNPLQ